MDNKQSYLSLARTILAAFEEQEKEVDALKQAVISQQGLITDLQNRLAKLEQQSKTKKDETVKGKNNVTDRDQVLQETLKQLFGDNVQFRGARVF